MAGGLMRSMSIVVVLFIFWNLRKLFGRVDQSVALAEQMRYGQLCILMSKNQDWD